MTNYNEELIDNDDYCYGPYGQLPWRDLFCIEAVYSGKLEMIQWGSEQGYPCSMTTISTAAYVGHLDIVRWLHQNGCPWDRITIENAALEGHLDIVKYCVAHGLELPIDFFDSLDHNNLPMIQYFHENGAVLTSENVRQAAYSGSIVTIDYLYDQGAVFDNEVLYFALSSGNFHLLDNLLAKGLQYDQDLLPRLAFDGSDEALTYLDQRGIKLAWSDELHVLLTERINQNHPGHMRFRNIIKLMENNN